MSEKLIAPDLRRILDDIKRRVEILERRITNAGRAAATPAAGHTHDGSGTDAVILTGDTQSGAPDAPGDGAVAAGQNAYASGDYAVAIGPNANAQFGSAIALGDAASANGVNAAALGSSASADYIDATALGSDSVAAGMSATAVGANSNAHEDAVAIGYNVSTTDPGQVNFGARQLVFGGSAVTSSGDLLVNQVAIYVDEATNTFVIKAKYAGGTVKTGTVTLA